MMRRFLSLTLIASVLALGGCSALNPFARKSPRNDPAPLVKFNAKMALRKMWSVSIGKSDAYVFTPTLVDGKLYVGSADGTVASIDAGTGKTLWRVNAGVNLTAGVGSDGNTVAVAGTDGALIALDAANGKIRWKGQATTEVLSAPAVGSGMVIVRSLDNRIVALDGQTGLRRWFLQRAAPALALRAAPGIVIADGIAYVALPGGRMIAAGALNGAVRWEASIAEPRGATELERVVDVSGTPVLADRDICATTYQGRIACADISNGTLRWARELSAEVGPGMDEGFVFGADERGNVQAFSREGGASQWRNTTLGWRDLSAPVSFGRAVVVGDRQGYLHFLSREDGAVIARESTDGSPIRATPIVAGSSLIVQTAAGKLLALSAK